MTRFNISLEEGVSMVLHAIEHAWGGEIFVPKIPSYKITEVARAIAPGCKQEIIGIRPGEKVHEEMITESDSFYTVDVGKYYAVLHHTTDWNTDDYIRAFGGERVPVGFKYNSGTNTEWLSAEQIRELIVKHVDPNFKPL
jgi:FlaA1/EpsC-like NDP-sugar epimerase